MLDEARLRAFVRSTLFLLLTFVLLPFYALAACISTPLRTQIQYLWCGLTLRILGVKLHRQGRAFRANPTLFVANHTSYLDILAVGRMAEATFIAKLEIANWPLFGVLGKLAGTYFIRRYWRDALIQRNSLGKRLRDGESFVLFAEGTSSNGLDVLPFKTSLLSVAEPWVIDRPIAVQPVTIRYLRLRDGSVPSLENINKFAWFGDHEFLPHLWRLTHQGGIEMEVIFGDPVISWSVRNRKTLGRPLRHHIRNEIVGCRNRTSAYVSKEKRTPRHAQTSV